MIWHDNHVKDRGKDAPSRYMVTKQSLAIVVQYDVKAETTPFSNTAKPSAKSEC